tara:strand:+ start:607 stop:1179 length:573 start_codon:yes stop_codon:yes gene_type:complete
MKYVWNNADSDVGDLILAINTLGENLTGLELGVGKGESFMTILNNCSMKKLYGVDNWKPYTDYLKTIPDGNPCYHVNEEQQDIARFFTYHYVNFSDQKKKVKILEMDSMEAVKHIPNKSLDFIFFDAMMTEEQSYEEAKAYYPKIKKGGFFTGHDAVAVEQVMKPISKVKEEYNNTNSIKIFNNCFLFKI